MNVGKEIVTCPECGREHEMMVIDGHLDFCKLCSACILDILKGHTPNA